MNPFGAVATAIPRLENLLRQWQPWNAVDIEQAAADALDRLEHQSESGPGFPGAKSPKVIVAAGGLVWSGPQAARRIALIHRNRYDDWSFPKGKLKSGEGLSQAAKREVWEETGCQPSLTAYAGLLCYAAKKRLKLVFFWQMEASDAGFFTPSEEVDQVEWLGVTEALGRLSYDMERDLLQKVTAGQEH